MAKNDHHQTPINVVVADMPCAGEILRMSSRTNMAGLNIARAANNGNPRSRMLVAFLIGLQVKFMGLIIHIMICIIKRC